MRANKNMKYETQTRSQGRGLGGGQCSQDCSCVAPEFHRRSTTPLICPQAKPILPSLPQENFQMLRREKGGQFCLTSTPYLGLPPPPQIFYSGYGLDADRTGVHSTWMDWTVSQDWTNLLYQVCNLRKYIMSFW